MYGNNVFTDDLAPNPQNVQHSIFGFDPYPPNWTAPQPVSSWFNFNQDKPSQPVTFPFQVDKKGCKRKIDLPPLQVCKQHITEEKMAEHMSKLHISSETAASSSKEPESQRDRTKRLYMCEEMRKLQSDSILPKSLLERIQRPCTAVVLWQPPPSRLVNEREIDENDNNNFESQPDMMDGENLVVDVEMDK